MEKLRRLGRIIFFPKICGLRKLGQKTDKNHPKKCKNGENLKVFRFSPKPDKITLGWVLIEEIGKNYLWGTKISAPEVGGEI